MVTVPRRAARPALVIVVLLLAASAYVTVRWDGPGDHQALPRAAAAAPDQVAAAAARSPRVLGLLLAVLVSFALPARNARRRPVWRTARTRPRPALLRVASPRGPPLLFVASS
jgi:hypothetical protein